MKGTLKKVNSQWLVYYQEEVMPRVTKALELPLYPGDIDTLKDFEAYRFGDGSKIFDQLISSLAIQFEIIDEFTHPQLYNGLEWGSGKMAKLL